MHATRHATRLYLEYCKSSDGYVSFLLATVMQFLIYMEVPELCAICKHPVDSGDHSASTLYPKGSLAINEASNSRKDSIHTVPGEMVHKDRRRKFCSQGHQARGVNAKHKQ